MRLHRNFGQQHPVQRPSTHPVVDWLIALAAMAVIVVMLLLGFGFYSQVRGQPVTQQWLLSWIPSTCCVTNTCCWQISESELQSLPGDNWMVKSTGQIRKRTAYSPDGKFYRCACDYDGATQTWIKHQGAKTRCIFVPMRSVGR